MDAEHAAKIDHIERIQAKVSQVVVHRLGQLFWGESRSPRSVGTAPRPDFGHNDEVAGVGLQRFADQLIGDVRPVEVAGVDMIHTARHRFAQDSNCCLRVLRWTEYAGPRELHGAVAEPPYGASAEVECAGLMNSGHGRSPLRVGTI